MLVTSAFSRVNVGNFVIPAQARIHVDAGMDPRFSGDDIDTEFLVSLDSALIQC